MSNVNTNICLEEGFWLKCKNAAARRRISLNQLVKNGLLLALNQDEAIKVGSSGRVANDLRGVLAKKRRSK
jgi:predicted DNA-binding ribbon-helix-helix protein